MAHFLCGWNCFVLSLLLAKVILQNKHFRGLSKLNKKGICGKLLCNKSTYYLRRFLKPLAHRASCALEEKKVHTCVTNISEIYCPKSNNVVITQKKD